MNGMLNTLIEGARSGRLAETIQRGTRNRLTEYLIDHRRARSYLDFAPDTLVIEATNRCNQRCTFCPTGLQTNPRPKGSMSRETFEACIEGLGPLTRIQFAGFGEPFLHPDLENRLDRAARQGIDVELYSNFTAIGEDRVRGLLDHPFHTLIVSLDAMDRETYRAYKRVDQFDRAFENVCILSDEVKRRGGASQKLMIQMLLTRKNQHQQAQFVETVEKLGLVPNIKAALLPEMSEADEAKILEWHVPGPSPADRAYGRKCPFIWRMMIVYWNGDVSLCCHDPMGKATYGNIRDGGPIELFIRGRQALRRLYFDDPSQIGCCKHCDQA